MADAAIEKLEMENVFPEIDPLGRRRGQMSEAAIKRLNERISLEETLSRTGVDPCTVLNLNPYPLHIDAPYLDHITVPACPPGRPFSMTVIRKHAFAWSDKGEDNWSCLPILPIQLGREFERHYYNNGGVVIYKGDGEETSPATDARLKGKIDEATKRLYDYAEGKIREGDAFWNSEGRKQAKAITPEIHCALAKKLHDERGDELPEWVNKKPGEYGLGNRCVSCSAIPPSNALLCPNCGEPTDPEKAFMAVKIGPQHASLARLTREKLDLLGITREDCPETIQERTARVAAIAKKTAKAGK